MPKVTNTFDMARMLIEEGALDRSLAPYVYRAEKGDKAAEQHLEEAIVEFVKAHPDGYEGKNGRFIIQYNTGILSPGRAAMMSGKPPANFNYIINQLVLRGVDRQSAEQLAPSFARETDQTKLRSLLNAAATEYKKSKEAGGTVSESVPTLAPDVRPIGKSASDFENDVRSQF